MKSKLTHNLELKIMAILFSLVLWMIAVDINNPVTNKTFYNVKVQLINTGSITGQNKTYKVADSSDIIRVTVRAPQSILSSIDEENITARADCSKLTAENTVPIELTVNGDVESTRMDKENVQLEIENRTTKQLSIEVVKNGTLPDGYVTGRSTLESNMMSVTGPESVVDQVSKAVVEVSLEDVTSDIDMVTAIRLLNEEGVEISSSELRRSIDSVKVTVPILKTKEVPVSWQTSGSPADGYALTGTVSSTPETVLIAGRENALNNVSGIDIPAAVTDVTGLEESFSRMVDVREYLPSDVVLAEPSFSGYVTLTAEIEAIRRRTISITESTIQVLNVPEGWQAEIVQDQGLRLNISGLGRNLNNVDETVLVPHVDVSTLVGEDGTVPAGEQEITVNFLIPENVRQEGSVTARIRLTRRAEE